jgi:hypothetical protein
MSTYNYYEHYGKMDDNEFEEVLNATGRLNWDVEKMLTYRAYYKMKQITAHITTILKNVAVVQSQLNETTQEAAELRDAINEMALLSANKY